MLGNPEALMSKVGTWKCVEECKNQKTTLKILPIKLWKL